MVGIWREVTSNHRGMGVSFPSMGTLNSEKFESITQVLPSVSRTAGPIKNQ